MQIYFLSPPCLAFRSVVLLHTLWEEIEVSTDTAKKKKNLFISIYLFIRWGFAMFPRLVLNSGAQVIFLPQPPEELVL